MIYLIKSRPPESFRNLLGHAVRDGDGEMIVIGGRGMKADGGEFKLMIELVGRNADIAPDEAASPKPVFTCVGTLDNLKEDGWREATHAESMKFTA